MKPGKSKQGANCMNKEYPVCATCGSADVSTDAWGSWNIDRQVWELENAFDYSHCNNCEGECDLKWYPITVSLAEILCDQLEL